MHIIPISLDQTSQVLIKNMWIIEETNGFNINVKAFPTGYPYINVISGKDFTIKNNNGDVIEASSYISGNALYPFELNMRVIKRVITIQLQPYAIPYLTGIPADEFSELRVPISQFSTDLANRLEELINSDLKSVLILKKVLDILSELKNEAILDKRIIFVLKDILSTKGNISLEAINSKVNLSQRRLQQLFKTHLGMSAKSYTKVVRMQSHTYDLLMGRKLESIVPDSYFDQSHFIHEVRKQTSMSPTEFHKFIIASEHKNAYLVSNLFFGI